MFRTQFQIKRGEFPSVYDDEKKRESKTKFGMAMTVKELYTKCATGNIPAIAKMAIWDDHPAFDNWDRFVNNMDLVDAQGLMQEMVNRRKEIVEEENLRKRKEGVLLEEKIIELQSKIDELTGSVTEQ